MSLILQTKNCQRRGEKVCLEDTLPLNLQSSIKSLCEREGFTTYQVEQRCVSTNGCSYLSVLYEIDIKGRTKKGVKELNLFVKHVVDGATIKILSMSDVYATEIFAYMELSKIFALLQEQASVPLEERYKMIHAFEESNASALIMDNMVKRGYTSMKRIEVASLNFFELAVKQLARFHGLSFVLRELRPEYFKKKIKSLKCAYIFNETWMQMIAKLKKTVVNYVDIEFKDKLEKAYDITSKKYHKLYDDDSLKISLCHGDYRHCNIMIKVDDGEIKDLIPIDYQLIHCSNPVLDFLYLIFSATDRKFRKANLLNLKEMYYKTLAAFLKYFDLEVNAVYPREDFDKVYEEHLDFGLMNVMLYAPLAFVYDDAVPDFSNDEVPELFHLDIKERLHGVLQDYTDWGFL